MDKRVIFLYYGYKDKISSLVKENLHGVYFRPNSNLVGLDLAIIDKNRRFSLMKEYSLREFEVEQNNFEEIFELLYKLKARITNVEISNLKYFPSELQDKLLKGIEDQNINEIIEVIHDAWDLGHDINSVEFYLYNSRIRFTRLAELDVSTVDNDIAYILNTLPIGVLAGVVKEGGVLQ